MAIMRQYLCDGHGIWETNSRIVDSCPYGCSKFQRYFESPPGIKGVRTKNHDLMQREIAKQFGLTDMNNKNGESLMSNQMRANGSKNSFALPSTPLSQPGTNPADKKKLDLGGIIGASGAFGANVPSGVVTERNAFQQAQQAVAGSRAGRTQVFAACDKNGNPIRPG